MMRVVVEYVESKSTATLHEMKIHLQNTLPDRRHVSAPTISRHLDGAMISLKNVRPIPHQWNSLPVKEERHRFVEWLMQHGADEALIYCDEFGINIWTARTKGRAPVGQRAVRVLEGQRGPNLIISLCVSPVHSLVHYMLSEGGYTKQHFLRLFGGNRHPFR